MSYIRLNIENLQETREKVRKALLDQDRGIAGIKGEVEVHQAKLRKSRRLFAVDSGFNTAYETPFVLFKAAVVDEDIRVEYSEGVCLFHVDDYQTDRLRRLFMQQMLYEALMRKVETESADGSIVLVDGTITLTVFYPTLKDGREYRQQFKGLYENLYSPLVDECLKRDIILLGFLKRTGSTYLAENLGAGELYDIYIMDAILQADGKYILPISIVDTHANRAAVHHDYVTFYLNLKGWNYRFELVKQQEEKFLECIENLLFWATEAHYGMNPIFSKADEYARVTKREANLKFNYIIHDLSEEDKVKLRLEARRRTHFGYRSGRLPEGLMRG
ncbi:MAG: DNA double-strand break repair nuclease NurA [Candidatus Bathyarchaeia archaeon]